MLKLNIPGDIFEQMLLQANDESPLEACGILAGRDGAVEKFYAMTNTDRSNEHFTMAPEEQFRVVKDIRGAGLEMLAIYHSHPESAARPSEEDICLALTMDVIYVIVSLEGEKPAIKGFVIEDEDVTEVLVRIEA